MIKKVTLCAALAGLAFCAAQIASAGTNVTFQVDMSSQVGSTFNPPGDKIFAFGSFNNWSSGFQLTNDPSAANTNLYSGTLSVSNNTGGSVMDYKYVINGNFENTQDGNNRCATLPADGSSQVLDIAFYNDNGPPITVNMTFQVDMAQQIVLGKFDPVNGGVYAQGLFEGWVDSGAQLTNDPSILRTNANNVVTSNVYTGVIQVTSAPGGTENYKFVYNNNDATGDHYESPTSGDPDQAPGGNRFFDGQTNDATLPIVFFSDAPFVAIRTNLVTFQVDMTAQVLNNNFNPAVSQVNVNGSFDNFTANRFVLTNDPAGANTNLYTGSFSIVDGQGAPEQYKFTTSPIGVDTITPNYESLNPSTPTIAGNRFFNIVAGTTLVLPIVNFSDTPPPPASEFLTNSVDVTFTVDMTNAVGTDATVWDPTVNVYINGDFIGWPAFNTALPQLTEVVPGVGSIYTYTTTIPAGHAVKFNYDYSMNGAADETTGANHVRYIRSYGSYSFPTDIFGSPVVENSFGNLTVGQPSGNQIPVSWLGRPGVQLQATTDLIGGTWTNVPGTDAMSAANLTVTGTKQYFRLVHPLLPLE